MEFIATEDAAFDQAVVIFPPADRQARIMFKMMMMTELEKILTRTPNLSGSSTSSSSSCTKRVAWSDRGWRRRDDFLLEMEKALSDGQSSTSGVVIARGQTRQEAEALVEQLAANATQVKAAVVSTASARMYSSVAGAPCRLPSASTPSSSSSGGESKDEKEMGSAPIEFCSPTAVRHHIVLYAPDTYLSEDYEWDTAASGEFIDQWYDQEISSILCRIMRPEASRSNTNRRSNSARNDRHNRFSREAGEEEEDEEEEAVGRDDEEYYSGPGTFSWSDRGWVNRSVFLAHTKASLKKTGQCSFLRRATYSDAITVFQALEEAGFFASLFVTPSLEAEKGEEDRPVLLCEMGHPTTAVENGYHSTCAACGGQSRPDDLMMRCTPCEVDLCSACVTERTRMPCPVLAGRYCGHTLLHPSTSAMSLLPAINSSQSDQQREGVDALTFLSSQVAGDNTNMGSVGTGGDEEAAMMGRLDGVFGRMGVEKNGKPKAKASAVAALVREVMGEGEHSHSLKDESCIICMNEFQPGEVVMQMPCGHWFHEGVVESNGAAEEKKEGSGGNEDDEEGPCDGILPWLQSSNRCPMCRVEIEADTGAAIEKLVPSLAGPWTCPGCREEQSSYTCSSCDVRRNVHIAATHTAKHFFESVDALFFDFLGHHERKRRGLAASIQELELYYLRIDFLLNSEEGEQLVQNSWRIREAVEHLLKVAFKGKKHFTFSAPWMDSNSKALYVLLVDKLKAKIKTLNISEDSFTFELPTFSARSDEGGEADWSCPVCNKLNGAEARACDTCGCDCKVLVIAQSTEEMQNVQRIFLNAESMVFRAFDIMTDRHASDGLSLSATAALDVLKKEVDIFLRSLDVRRVEHAGWKIKCHLAELFEGLCKQESEVSFQYYNDVTSAGLYAVLVRRLRRRLAEDTERIPEYSRFLIREPAVSSSVKQDEDYEPLSGQRFYVHGQTFGLLQTHRKLFMTVAHLIAEKASENYWGNTVKMLAQFGERWPIDARVELMKSGERNLDVLTDELECFAQAVVEAILRKVVALEAMLHATTSTGDSDGVGDGNKGASESITTTLTVAELTTETSMDVATRCLLQELKGEATEAMFKQSLKLLLKCVRALTTAPDALSSRRMRKSTPAVAQCVLNAEHSQLLAIFLRLGFVEEDSFFSLLKLQPDLVSKALSVAEEFAHEINLK